MAAEVLGRALLVWWLEAAVFLSVALVLPLVLRIEPPEVRLRYFQAVLGAVLLLPLLTLGASPPSGAATVSSAVLRVSEGLNIPEPPGIRLWVVGLVGVGGIALLRLLWLLLGFRALHRWCREAGASRLAAGILAQPPSAAALQILVSPRVGSPLTFGWRRPKILLPSDFGMLPLEIQRAMLQHELLHIERRDWLMKLGEELLLCLLWFHPALWLLVARLDLAREQTVDAEVVRRSGGDSRPYLRSLLHVAERVHRRSFSLSFLHHRHLLSRVAQLTKESEMSRPTLSFRLFLAAGFLALAAFTAAHTFPMYAAAASSDDTATEEDVLRVGGDVLPPKLLERELPVYPQSAREKRIQGVVIVEAVINVEGRVESTRVLKHLPEGLDQAAVDAIEQWVFEPATRHGEPVAVYYVLTVNFQLDEEDEAEGR